MTEHFDDKHDMKIPGNLDPMHDARKHEHFDEYEAWCKFVKAQQEPKKCESCKWWSAEKMYGDICYMFDYDENKKVQMAYVSDSHAFVITSPNFYCSEWQEKMQE